MFKNIKNVKKIIILIITIMLIIVGIYIKTEMFQKDLTEVQTVAKDNFGYTENEQLTLEVEKLDKDLYEIKFPENINTKEVNKVTDVILEDKSNQEKINLEVIDNKIQLTKEQLKNYKINLAVEYNAVIKQKQDDGTLETIKLIEKTNEEIQNLEITDKTEILYEKILKNEEQEDTTISLKGNVPEDAQLQVEKVPEEKIKEIFGDVKIDVAYDIKVLKNGSTEINPKDFEEIYKVSIENEKITKNSIIYHVKDDNTYEYAQVTENEEGNLKFNAESFSIYAIYSIDDEIEENPGEDSGAGHPYQTRWNYSTSDEKSGSIAATDNNYPVIKVPAGGWVKVTNQTYQSIALCHVEGGGNCVDDHSGSFTLYAGYHGLYGYSRRGHADGAYGTWLTITSPTPPTVKVSPTSAGWRNSALTLRITVTQGSNSLASPSYEYYLSTSSSALSGGSWNTYTGGKDFSINPGKTGTYYLFVRRVKDTSGNYSTSNGTDTTVSSTTYHRYGTYKFDYTAPTAGTMTMKLRQFQWK